MALQQCSTELSDTLGTDASTGPAVWRVVALSTLNLADCWSLEGPRDVSTEERVERATTRHTAGPVEASVPSVSDSSVEHCCKAICDLIQRNIEKKKKETKKKKKKEKKKESVGTD